MMRRVPLIIAAIMSVPLLFSWSLLTMRAASKASPQRPVIEISARVLQPYTQFLRKNDLQKEEANIRRYEDPDDFPYYLTARADDRYVDDPGGIVLTYAAVDCPVTLPAGRQFRFGHVGPILDDIEAIFPLEPMSWDDMQAMVTELIGRFDGAGWKRVPAGPQGFSVTDGITAADFLRVKSGTKWTRVGYWRPCDSPEVLAYAEVRHYDSSSPGSFMPPAALSQPLPDEAPDRFLMRVTFRADDAARDELRELRDARRIEVTGSPDREIPVSIWFDDPDWRPDDWNGKFVK